MTIADPYLMVRAAALYLTAAITLVVWLWRRPARRLITGAALAFAWNLPVLLLLNVAAARAGWWDFSAQGGVLLNVPVDLYAEWAWVWGALPALALPSAPLGLVTVVALSVDLLLMPHAVPVMRLGPAWLAGEAIGLGIGLIPGQLLARWTAGDRRLHERVLLQILLFAGLVLFLLPVIVITQSRTAWESPLGLPRWQLALWIQMLMLVSVIGLAAVQEFATRGNGTPLPFDPPTRLVTTGIYAFVANPMQLSAVVLFLVAGLMLRNVWVAMAGVMAHLYSAGLAGWDEDEDLRARFGDRWCEYRRSVRRWIPRFRPWRAQDQPPAVLFVAANCDMCREGALWFERRNAVGLRLVPAETHSSQALKRITYEPADGSRPAAGVEAVARALEHLHIGWAFTGFLMRLPVVCELAQLLADASGAEPRTLSSLDRGL